MTGCGLKPQSTVIHSFNMSFSPIGLLFGLFLRRVFAFLMTKVANDTIFWNMVSFFIVKIEINSMENFLN